MKVVYIKETVWPTRIVIETSTSIAKIFYIHIRQDKKYLKVTNTPAYFEKRVKYSCKSFIILRPGALV